MARIVFPLLADVLQFAQFVLLSHARLAAENLFLRKQLALYVERQVEPRRATNATRLTLVVLARFIESRPILTIVRPDTLGGTATRFGCSGGGSPAVADDRRFRRRSNS